MQLEVGFGPMSLDIIDNLVDYAAVRQRKIMIIASRNQVDAASLDGGYVLDTESFVNRVRHKDRTSGKLVKICRDHSGPFLSSDDKGLHPTVALERTLESLKTDIECGFDLIHIDPSMSPDPYSVGEKMFEAVSGHPQIELEFGSEENTGVAASVEKFEQDVMFAKQFCNPRFVVGQTGTLTGAVHQRGTFDALTAHLLVEIARKHDTELKEHNVDYTSREEIELRKKVGIGGINIAPELGAIQTGVTIGLALKLGLTEEVAKFQALVLSRGNWKKWMVDESWNSDVATLAAGHYHFSSPEYHALREKVSTEVPFDECLRTRLFEALDIYAS